MIPESRPMMHTETNLAQGSRGDEAVYWLWKEWANVLRLRNSGVPIVGFTWYSITDQIDWDVALREEQRRAWEKQAAEDTEQRTAPAVATKGG
jgi:hypothetical protein